MLLFAGRPDCLFHRYLPLSPLITQTQTRGLSLGQWNEGMSCEARRGVELSPAPSKSWPGKGLWLAVRLLDSPLLASFSAENSNSSPRAVAWLME